MAAIYADRVQSTTTTTGTGTYQLGGASTGFQSFLSAVGSGNTCYYCCTDGTNWEVGYGTVTSGSPNTLSRTTILSSSNSNAAVSWSSGTRNIFLTVPATDVMTKSGNGTNVSIDSQDLILANNTSPAAPPSNNVKLFGLSIANRMMAAQIGPSGLSSSLQPWLARNKVGYWNPQGNSTTLPGVFGFTAVTTSSTATARTVATTNMATRMRRIGYPTSTTAGSMGGARVAVAQFSCGSGSNDGSGFLLIERWVESDPASVSGKRSFSGMTSSTSAPTNVEASSLTNAIGVAQLSTDATQWYWIGSGSTAQSAVACGTTVGAPGGNSTTAWELAIFAPNSVANTYYLQLTNISTGATTTTTFSGDSTAVPQSSTLLAWRHWCTNNATAASAGIDICSIYIETDN